MQLGILQFVPLLVMLVAFYFFLIRPQQQQQKKRQEMLNKLERGDKILTIGGLQGEIVAIRDDVLTVRLADNVEVKLHRSGVGQVL
ncbi:MAG TPA: preprotein translocase subunit YajC [Firmicutes bacterium]|nr:preprotein translocase subunit YajC [Bacillota bacterium]